MESSDRSSWILPIAPVEFLEGGHDKLVILDVGQTTHRRNTDQAHISNDDWHRSATGHEVRLRKAIAVPERHAFALAEKTHVEGAMVEAQGDSTLSSDPLAVVRRSSWQKREEDRRGAMKHLNGDG